jgi:Na+-driven multidrug efflux pump
MNVAAMYMKRVSDDWAKTGLIVSLINVFCFMIPMLFLAGIKHPTPRMQEWHDLFFALVATFDVVQLMCLVIMIWAHCVYRNDVKKYRQKIDRS